MAAPIAFAGISSYALVSERRGTARRSKLLILVTFGFLGAVVAAFLGGLSLLPETVVLLKDSNKREETILTS
ncbi:hypothetical protein [Desulfosporosinus sp. SB140]|uniref:hypothetical protein n=1 Tax=Desulfosporosinus paludis TaxID=3115649 RepID=UPI003890D9B4